MPAVEISLGPRSSAKEDAFEVHPLNSGGGTHDDFDRVMQTTLAPHSSRSFSRNSPRTEKSSPSPKTSLPSTAGALAASKSAPNDSDHKVSEGKEKSSGRATDSDAAAPDAVAPDATAVPPTAEASNPPPAFLSFPLFLSGPAASAPTSAVLAQSTDSVAADSAEAAAASLATVSAQVTPGAVATDSVAAKPATSQLGSPNWMDLALLPNSSLSAAPLSPQSSASPTVAKTSTEAKDTAQHAKASSSSETSLLSSLKLTDLKPDSTSASSSAKELPEAATSGDLREPGAVISLDAATLNAGTGVANTNSPMKNPLKTNKVAGLDAKVLPVGETGDADEKNLPPQLLVTPVRSAESHSSDLSFASDNGASQTAENTAALKTVDLPSLTDARMRALDRTHDMVALHTMRLVESKSDVLSVVIKPSVGTELSLELRQRADGVTAQATLTRGDREFLSQHWPELQQRLEQRGIKLSPLGSEGDFSSLDGGSFQQSQYSHTDQEEAAQQASAFAEFAATSPVSGGASARLAVVHDGWESWA